MRTERVAAAARAAVSRAADLRSAAVNAADFKNGGGTGRMGGRDPQYVEPLEGRQLMAGNPWGWQATLIGQDTAATHFPTITGAGYSVVVIDSGVDYKHPNLGGGMGAGFKVIGGYDFAANDTNPFSDTNAHGTATAGVIAGNGFDHAGKHYSGIAPGANIISLKVNGGQDIKEAFDWVHANRAKYNIAAVNYVDLTGSSAAIFNASLRTVIADGIFVTRPAGNGGAGSYLWPGAGPADFFIGSVNSSGAISSFSNRGADLDLLAPGEGVTVPYYDVRSGAHTIAAGTNGTSWASPAVAGTAVLIKQINPKFTPLEIMAIMKDSGTATYDPASKLTYKRLNVSGALSLAYQRRATPQAPASSGPVAGAVQSPFGGSAFKINATGTSLLQAENFDAGLEGVAYHDREAKNLGGDNYRSGAGVDLYKTTSGARLVAHAMAGEWVEYTVDVVKTGNYTFSASAASLARGGTFHMEVDGVNKTGAISVANSGSWLVSRTTAKTHVNLTAGRHVLRVVMDSNSTATGAVGNFDSFSFTAVPPAATPMTATAPVVRYNPFAAFAAASFSSQVGVSVIAGKVGYVDQGDQLVYSGVNFGAGATRMEINLAVPPAYAGKKIVIRTGSATGPIIGSHVVKSTGAWGAFQTQALTVSKTTGVQNLYVTFEGGGAVANLNWFRFAA